MAAWQPLIVKQEKSSKKITGAYKKNVQDTEHIVIIAFLPRPLWN